jgi:hypothetical protein
MPVHGVQNERLTRSRSAHNESFLGCFKGVKRTLGQNAAIGSCP